MNEWLCRRLLARGKHDTARHRILCDLVNFRQPELLFSRVGIPITHTDFPSVIHSEMRELFNLVFVKRLSQVFLPVVNAQEHQRPAEHVAPCDAFLRHGWGLQFHQRLLYEP